jgi:NAD(P)-dependent dehydrogenase (short-subunit alcohol dehydrogenase family)
MTVEMTAPPVALVTGAGAGIGLATSRAFAVAGYAVVLSDLDGGASEAAAAALRDEGHAATSVRCDISSPEDVDALLQAVEERHGRLDAVHANAGYSAYKLLEEMTVEEIRHQLDVNLLGHLLVVRAATGLLARSGGGSIVFTSSVQGHITLPGCAPYAAAKAGLMAVARALSVELGDRGIRVNTVSPGTIDTPMLRRDLSGMNTAETAAFVERVNGANALGRIGEAREIADVVVFLCSDGASYITGVDVPVDGGFLRVKKF